MTQQKATVIHALPDRKPQLKLSVTKEGMALSSMLIGTTLASVGAGVAWGPGLGMLVAGALLFVYGILLGIG